MILLNQEFSKEAGILIYNILMMVEDKSMK